MSVYPPCSCCGKFIDFPDGVYVHKDCASKIKERRKTVRAKRPVQQLKPKMPLLEEVQQMYVAHIGYGERVTSVELGAVEFAYYYISRHFGRC